MSDLHVNYIYYVFVYKPNKPEVVYISMPSTLPSNWQVLNDTCPNYMQYYVNKYSLLISHIIVMNGVFMLNFLSLFFILNKIHASSRGKMVLLAVRKCMVLICSKLLGVAMN